jgi:hypothetical protein
VSTISLELRSLCLEVEATHYPAESDSAEGWDIEGVYVTDDEGELHYIEVSDKFRTEIYEAIEKQVAQDEGEHRIARWESERDEVQS